MKLAAPRRTASPVMCAERCLVGIEQHSSSGPLRPGHALVAPPSTTSSAKSRALASALSTGGSRRSRRRSPQIRDRRGLGTRAALITCGPPSPLATAKYTPSRPAACLPAAGGTAGTPRTRPAGYPSGESHNRAVESPTVTGQGIAAGGEARDQGPRPSPRRAAPGRRPRPRRTCKPAQLRASASRARAWLRRDRQRRGAARTSRAQPGPDGRSNSGRSAPPRQLAGKANL